ACQLCSEGSAIGSYRYYQQTEQTNNTVYRDRTHRVIDFQFVHGQDGNHHDHTANQTDQSGYERSRSIRAGSDGNQTSQSAVQSHGQIRFAEEQVTQQQSTDQTTSSRSVGVHEHNRYRMSVTDVAQFQYRTTVETEPAHPQDKGTQSGQRQVSTRDGTDFTVRAVFAFTGTQQNHTCQSSSRTRHVNDAGTGEVFEAHIAQRVQTEYRLTAPGPGTFHR